MTKKDYQAIAGALYKARMRSFNDQAQHNRSLTVVIDALADVIAADNPRFNRECFVAACEDGNVGRRPKREAKG